MSKEYILKSIDEAQNYFVEEKEQNALMSNKQKMVCATLNYTEYFLVQTSVVIGCISIYASLPGISISITSSAIGLKNCAITERIK